MRKILYPDTYKTRTWKEIFNKNKYIYGLQRTVIRRKFYSEIVGRWESRMFIFDNFQKAMEWFLAGEGVRWLGGQRDKQIFEECYGRIR